MSAGHQISTGATAPATSPSDIIAFWSEAGPSRWFRKDEEFDRRFRETFLAAHESACRGDLDHWQRSPGGALALILLLDQFPRNAFRGTARVYASDTRALEIARAALAAGHDRHIDADLRLFLYLPFNHSEVLEDQELCIELCRALGDPESLAYAVDHRDIVKRFGRFPHRNSILGRTTTDEERRFLDEGGFSG